MRKPPCVLDFSPRSRIGTTVGVASCLILAWIATARAEPLDLSAIQMEAHQGRVLRITTEIESRPRVVQGKLQSYDATGVRLRRSGEAFEVAAESIVKIELLPKGRWKGLVVGAAVWGGAAYGFSDADGGEAASRVAVGMEGMLVGALIGALFDRSRQPEIVVLYERGETDAESN